MTTFPGTSLYISGTHIWITVFICQCFISDKQVSCLIWVRSFITVLKNTRQIGQWPTLIIWYWHFARGLDDSINVMKNDQKSCWNVVLLYLNKFYNKQHSCIWFFHFFKITILKKIIYVNDLKFNGGLLFITIKMTKNVCSSIKH